MNKGLQYLLIAFGTVLLGLLAHSSAAQVSGCCVLQNGCQPAGTASECPTGATFQSSACTELTSCTFGCCCGVPGTNKGRYRNTCIAETGSVASFTIPNTFPQQYDPFFVDNTFQPSMCDSACGTVVPPCPTGTNSCEAAVDTLCKCGSTNAPAGKFCCAADGVGLTFDTQTQCTQNSACGPPQTIGYAVSGFVFENGNAATPIAGANVFLGSTARVSGADGAFTFTDVPPGSYPLTASKVGFRQTTPITISVIAADLANQNIALVRDQADTDSDGSPDTEDGDCRYEFALQGPRPVTVENVCNDNIDNDCDGTTFLSTGASPHTNRADCADIDCLSSPSCQSGPTGLCGDGTIQRPNGAGVFEQCDGAALGSCSACDPATCFCASTACPVGSECRSDLDCDTGRGESCANCQCIAATTSVCGDNQVTGYEECDVGVNPTDPADDRDTIAEGALVNCQGLCGPGGRPNACSCLAEYTCGNSVLEPPVEQCDQGIACASGTCNTNSCMCSDSCAENPAAPTNLAITPETNGMQLVWEMSGACQLVRYDITRCTGEDCEDDGVFLPLGSSPPTQRAFTDAEVEAETEYCYRVEALYTSGIIRQSAVVCAESSSQFCFDNPGEFCMGNAGFRCGADGEFLAVAEKNCTALGQGDAAFTCMEKDNRVSCVYQSLCEQCNGVLGLFWPEGTAVFEDPEINAPGGALSCQEIPTCFLDITQTSQDAYAACSGVTSCYDYRSAMACTADEDKCGVGPCEWVPSVMYGEVGKGVCRPVAVGEQDCGQCSDNREGMFESCNRDKCMLYGACYYQQSTKSCLDRDQISCIDYGTNALDCIGEAGTSVEVNVDWTTENCNPGESCRKTGPLGADANAIIQRSADILGLGTCELFTTPTGPTCIKDADNNNALGSDCRRNGPKFESCKRDNTPPITTLIPRTKFRDGKPLLGRQSRIGVSVRDAVFDATAPGEISTYSCLTPADEDCYPSDAVLEGVIPITITDVREGAYRIGYFSQDAGSNLEPVRYLDITLDTIPPRITVENATAEVLHTDGEYYSNLTLTLTAADNLAGPVQCTAVLRAEGAVVQPYNTISQYGNSFTRTYFNLEDGLYRYNVSCTDDAGNTVAEERSIDLSADPSITNPLPRGTLGPRDGSSVTLSVETSAALGPAACRFAEDNNFVFNSYERDPSYYDSIDPVNGERTFTDGGFTETATGMAMTPDAAGTRHTATIAVPSGTGPYLFNVKCRFPNGVTKGNRADRIIFSTDFSAPTIRAVSCTNDTPINASASFGQPIQVCFTCDDASVFDLDGTGTNRDPLSLQAIIAGYFRDFGCRRMNFCIARESGQQCTEVNLATTPRSAPVRITESVTVQYQAEDNGGNVASGLFNLIVDTTFPNVIANVRLSPTLDAANLTAFGFGQYFLFLTADRPMAQVQANLTIVGRAERHTLPMTRMTGDATNRVTVWTFTVPVLADLVELDNAQALVGVNGRDLFGHAIEDMVTFRFRSKAPRAPFLEPLLDGVEAANGLDYPDYPLLHRSDRDLYFLGQREEPKLFITGRTEAPPMEVLYYVNDRAIPQVSFDQRGNAADDPLDIQREVIRPASQGTALVSIRDLAGTAINGAFRPGNYVQFSNHERKVYGFYRNHYRIASARMVNPFESEITLADPLEADLPQGTTPVKASAFASPYPNNWFGQNITLREGNNTVAFAAQDAIGNFAPPQREFTIIFDPYPPTILSQTTPPAGTTGNNRTNITAVVRELRNPGSGINPATIQLKLDGVLRTNLRIESESDATFTTTTITYDPPGVLNGAHMASLSVADYAGNRVTREWEFEVDPNVPQRPTFIVLNAREVDGKWFTDRTPSFTLNFSATGGEVTVTSILLDGVINSLDFTCLEPSPNFFSCTIDEPLVPAVDANGMVTDDEFELVVSAYKRLEDGTRSGNGIYRDNRVVVDTITPQIDGLVDFTDYIRDNQELTIKLRIANELHGVSAVLRYREIDYPLTLLTNPDQGAPTHVFRWAVPDFSAADDVERPQPFTITVTDYVGHSASISNQVYIDLTPPDIGRFTIDVVNAPVRDPVAGYFATRITTIDVRGTFRDSDVSQVFTLPGSYSAQRRNADPRKDGVIDHTTDPPTFAMLMDINGPLSAETLNQYNVYMRDRAGYEVQRPMAVLADLRAPSVRQSRIS